METANYEGNRSTYELNLTIKYDPKCEGKLFEDKHKEIIKYMMEEIADKCTVKNFNTNIQIKTVLRKRRSQLPPVPRTKYKNFNPYQKSGIYDKNKVKEPFWRRQKRSFIKDERKEERGESGEDGDMSSEEVEIFKFNYLENKIKSNRMSELLEKSPIDNIQYTEGVHLSKSRDLNTRALFNELLEQRLTNHPKAKNITNIFIIFFIQKIVEIKEKFVDEIRFAKPRHYTNCDCYPCAEAHILNNLFRKHKLSQIIQIYFDYLHTDDQTKLAQDLHFQWKFTFLQNFHVLFRLLEQKFISKKGISPYEEVVSQEYETQNESLSVNTDTLNENPNGTQSIDNELSREESVKASDVSSLLG